MAQEKNNDNNQDDNDHGIQDLDEYDLFMKIEAAQEYKFDSEDILTTYEFKHAQCLPYDM